MMGIGLDPYELCETGRVSCCDNGGQVSCHLTNVWHCDANVSTVSRSLRSDIRLDTYDDYDHDLSCIISSERDNYLRAGQLLTSGDSAAVDSIPNDNRHSHGESSFMNTILPYVQMPSFVQSLQSHLSVLQRKSIV